MPKLWRRARCLVTGHRFAYKRGPLTLFDLVYVGTPAFLHLTELECKRCGLEGSR